MNLLNAKTLNQEIEYKVKVANHNKAAMDHLMRSIHSSSVMPMTGRVSIRN